MNIAEEAVDRWVERGRGDRVALRCIDRAGRCDAVTYRQLMEDTNRFANVLRAHGVEAGDRVFLLLDRGRALCTSALGTWKHRSVLGPLFPDFGPDPVRERISTGNGRVLVTTRELYRRRVAPVRDSLPGLELILLVGEAADVRRSGEPIPGAVDLAEALAAADPAYAIGPTDPEDLATLHFTSGTTGRPKAAMHVHGAVTAHRSSGQIALGLGPGAIFWCTADPGWVTGTTYGIISPLANGATVVVDQGAFDVERWYSILEREHVSVWYTTPTALRMLHQAGREGLGDHDLAALRLVASVGEPLDADTVRWTQEAWGTPAHDGWWQTETGGIMIANVAGEPVIPGSIGRPLPGVVATVLARDDRADADGAPLVLDGHVVEVTDPDVEGHLALRPGFPSMFRGYLDEERRYRACFVDGWYVTGDLVRRDAQGAYWFVGRADDVIKTSGHLVGPFEVEAALRSHPAVADAAVVGVPHPVAGTVIKAYVALRPGHSPSEELRRDLRGFARSRLGPAIAPRSFEFVDELPKTSSGKTIRRVLRLHALQGADAPLVTSGAAS